MKMERTESSLRCIECGYSSQELYHDYGYGIIKISHCPNCRQVVDKYIEFDPVIVLLDGLLFKPQAYRHVLFNKDITFHWKLSILCLLCDAYMKWAHKADGSSHTETEARPFLHYALQWDFYAMFLIAGLELAAFIFGVISVCWFHAVFTGKQKQWNTRLSCMVKALLLSSAGKLLVIPAVIWGETHVLTTRLLTQLFMGGASVQAITVILECRRITSISLVTCGFLTEFVVGFLAPYLETLLLPG